jgi:hypothetical protein
MMVSDWWGGQSASSECAGSSHVLGFVILSAASFEVIRPVVFRPGRSKLPCTGPRAR